MTELDARRVHDVVVAAKNFSRAADARRGAGGSSTGRWLPQGTRARAVAAEHLASIGLDAATVERELTAERAESQRRLEEFKAEAVAQSAARADSLRRLVGERVAGLDGLLATTGFPGAQYLALDSPVEIWTTDGLDLASSTIQPYNSRAKVRLDQSFYHGLSGAWLIGWNYNLLHFYYLWGNPQQDAYAVVTANAILTLNGFCSAHSRGGLVSGGKAMLSLDPTLDLVQTWTQPISSAPTQAGESQNALYLSADSTGFDSDDKTTYAVEFRGLILSYEQAIVPPGQYLIIDVALSVGWWIDNGEVSADFATGEFYVMSPLVELMIPASASHI